MVLNFAKKLNLQDQPLNLGGVRELFKEVHREELSFGCQETVLKTLTSL